MSPHRTISDMISFQLTAVVADDHHQKQQLPPISEVEDAKCECCGMSEECSKKREQNGEMIEEALTAHMNACARFNKFGRAYPVLFTAEAMREILRKSSSRLDGKSLRDKRGACQNKGGIARSSRCIPSITREINNLTLAT